MTGTSPTLSQFEALSFDCYGTLIDWETGLLEALEPMLVRASPRPSNTQVLEAYAAAEGEAETAHPTDPYPEILSRAWLTLAKRFGVAGNAVERERFGHSVGNWPAFPDTSDALKRLKRRYKLIILSNIDRASFAMSNRRLGVDFDRIITAQDLGSYKPDPRNFEALVAAVEEMGLARQKLLHVAQSLYHDHVQLQQSAEILKNRSAEFRVKLQKAKDPSFLEKEARDRFDLVSRGDLVFVFSDEQDFEEK